MPTTTASGRDSRLTTSVWVWTWAAVGLSIAIILVLAWLRFGQDETRRRASQILTRFREARTDLSKGILHLALSGDPRSPFREEVGLALLEQAVATLGEQESTMRLLTTTPNEASLLDSFETSVTSVHAQLKAYRAAEPAARQDLDLPLYLAFHDLEEFTERLDRVSRGALQDLTTQQNARFAVTLVTAMVLLGAMCGGVYQVNRRQVSVVEALHRSEGRLRETNRFLADLIEHSPALIFLKDREGRYELVNRKWEEVSGVPREQTLGRADRDLFPSPIGQQYEANDRRVLESGHPMEVEESLNTGSGDRTFLVVKFPVKTGDGDFRGMCGMATEITALKRTEAALRESEARYRLVSESSGDVLWLFDLDTNRFSFVSPSVERLRGFTAEEVLTQSLKDALTPESYRLVVDGLPGRLAAMEAGDDAARIQRHEVDQVRKDGTVVPTEVVTTLITDGGGRVNRIQGVSRDISERKRSEETLRKSEKVLRMFVEHSPAAIAMFDRQMRYIVASSRYLADYRLPEQDLSGQSHYDVFPEMDETRKEVHRRCLAGEVVSCEEDVLPRIDGTVDFVRYELRPWYDVDGGIGGLIFFSEVITEQKLAEKRLRESQERFRDLVETSHDWIWEVDAKGRYTYASPKVRDLLGYAPEEVVGRTPFDFMSDAEASRVKEVFNTLASRREPFSALENVNRRKDGREVVLETSGAPVLGSGGELLGYRGMDRDVTERRRLERERAALEAQMRQQQKLESLGTLASGVAHEINNPITGIMNYAQLIQDRLPMGSPLLEFTGEILHETQRVAMIVRNLLTFARNEKQGHSPARVVDITNAVLSLIRTVIRHDRITLMLDVAEDLPRLHCRSLQIQQVIMNLMTNARDALNERYPGHSPDKVMRLEARQTVRAGRDWIRITVEDHGTGITPEIRERMFDPFFTTKGRDVGTGLGLSISHGIIKEHEGEWMVESEPGRFTRMHVDLPVTRQGDL